MTAYPGELKEALRNAFDVVTKRQKDRNIRSGKRYDQRVKHQILHPGDIVLVKNTGIPSQRKMAPQWERTPYVVIKRMDDESPVYQVKPEGSDGPVRVLHRNLLLPFAFTADSAYETDNELVQEETTKKPRRGPVRRAKRGKAIDEPKKELEESESESESEVEMKWCQPETDADEGQVSEVSDDDDVMDAEEESEAIEEDDIHSDTSATEDEGMMQPARAGIDSEKGEDEPEPQEEEAVDTPR